MPRIDPRHALLLSLLGLVDAAVAIFTPLGQAYEPYVWLAIYAVWYILIVRLRPAAPIWQALATSMLSALWVAIAENALFGVYATNHPDVAAMVAGITPLQRVAGFTVTAFTYALTLGLLLGYLVRGQLRRGEGRV